MGLPVGIIIYLEKCTVSCIILASKSWIKNKEACLTSHTISLQGVCLYPNPWESKRLRSAAATHLQRSKQVREQYHPSQQRRNKESEFGARVWASIFSTQRSMLRLEITCSRRLSRIAWSKMKQSILKFEFKYLLFPVVLDSTLVAQYETEPEAWGPRW